MFTSFYFSTTRKYVIAFGTLFNDIIIKRTDSEGIPTQTIKVPLTYAPKDKMIARIEADPDLFREPATILPRMSFELTGLSYDSSRHKNTLNVLVKKDVDPNKLRMQYQSVPYNLNFNLYIYVKNAEDGTKIIEQILPYFKPQWDVSLYILPEMNHSIDVPIELKSVSPEDKYDGDFKERRVLTWTLSFTARGQYFGPIKKKPIIKFPRMDFYFGPDDPSELVGRYTVEPGLTVDGNPTSDPLESVDANLIDVDDDFGFIETSSGMILNE